MNNLINIQKKFGADFIADKNTFKMGIDRRITKQIAKRFKDRAVLETCTGGGFSTIALAESAERVITIEIDKKNQDQAIQNVRKAGLVNNVEFILGDCLNSIVLAGVVNVNAAFLDPDWNDVGKNHVYKFIDSNTRPPADILLNRIKKLTPNIALILPPYIQEEEFQGLSLHEFQKIYLEKELALFCLYFGNLINVKGNTELYV